MTPRSRPGRVAALLLTVVAAVLLVPGIAAAHSELVSEVPATGTTVPSPFSGPIVLTFSEHLATGSKADLVGSSGATLASATVDPNAMTMTFALTAPLDPGAYEVRWVSIADDLDLLRQPVVTFTVAPSASSSPVASIEPSAAASPTASAIASIAPTPAPSGAGIATSGSSDVVVPIIAALIVLGAGAAYLLSRRNRPVDQT